MKTTLTAIAFITLMSSTTFASQSTFCENCGPKAPACSALLDTTSPSGLNLEMAIVREEICRAAGKADTDISIKIVLYAQNKYLLIQIEAKISNLKTLIKALDKEIKVLKKEIKKADQENKPILEAQLQAVEQKKDRAKQQRKQLKNKRGYISDASDKLKDNIKNTFPDAKINFDKLRCVGPNKIIVKCS